MLRMRKLRYDERLLVTPALLSSNEDTVGDCGAG